MSNQHDQDRDRIAEAMRAIDRKDVLALKPVFVNHGFEYHDHLPPTLDAAIAAFETLCEPKGWFLGRDESGWNAKIPNGLGWVYADSGNHAADVCRLVCLVLDREANDLNLPPGKPDDPTPKKSPCVR